MRLLLLAVLAAVTLGAPATSASPPDALVPTPIGVGPSFHPPALSSRVARRREIGRLRCETRGVRRFGVHLELFARGRVVVVPAGIGVGPPWRSLRPHVIDGACSYAARTRTPIGVIEVEAGRSLTLGDFFEVWGQPLGRRRLVGFSGEPVRAYVDGTPWRGLPWKIPLRRHVAIALEVGPHVPPHPSFSFGMGL